MPPRTPNGVADTGNSRDRFLLNPALTDPASLTLFKVRPNASFNNKANNI